MADSSSPLFSKSPPPTTIDASENPAVDSAPADTAANFTLADAAINCAAADMAVESKATDCDDAATGPVGSNAGGNADSDSADSAGAGTEAETTAAVTAELADPSAAETENAPAPVIRMKPPPSSWTQQETISVVQAYGERWYANKRKPLKGNQWEEIAAMVASRGGSRSAGQSPKTPIQCRHKIDKLRKRFRAERHRGSSWNWQFYDLMNRLERGPHPPVQPLPVGTRRPTPAPAPTPTPTPRYRVNIDADNAEIDDNNDVDDMEDNEDDESQRSKSQSIHYILRRPTMVNRFPGERSSGGIGISGLPPNGMLQRITVDTEAAAEAEKLEEGRERRRVVSELASEIRFFAESYVKVENVKMEMMKDGEQRRMEMESKRMGMILDSQKKIAETMAKVFF